MPVKCNKRDLITVKVCISTFASEGDYMSVVYMHEKVHLLFIEYMSLEF